MVAEFSFFKKMILARAFEVQIAEGRKLKFQIDHRISMKFVS